MTESAASLIALGAGPEPARPLLTWYDDTTGERIELSGVTLSNWAAKTANLIVDGCGLGRGDPVAVLLPPHWQTAAVLLGCWTAGLAVRTSGPDADVVFAAAAVPAPVADRFLLGFAPMGLPVRGPLPDGWQDYIAQVRGHGDRFTTADPVRPGDPALDNRTHAGLLARATARAAELGIPAGGRVLVDTAVHPDPVDWLVAPLVSGASVVLCKDLDRAALAGRTAAERTDVTLG